METIYSNHFINPTKAEMGDTKFPFAFDMDSVLNDMGDDGMAAWIARHFGVTDARGIDDDGVYRFNFEVPGVSNNKMFKAVNQFIQTEGPSLLPSPWMKEVMEHVVRCTGLPVLVVTARSPENVHVTQRWLEEHLDNVPFRVYSIHGTDKTDKTEYLQHHDVKYFVDDRYNTNMKLYYNIPQPVMFKRPWNQGRSFYDWIQIDDLRDMIPLVNVETGHTPMDWPWNVPFPKPTGERVTKKYATII